MKKLIAVLVCVCMLAIPTAAAGTLQGVDISHSNSSYNQVNWKLLASEKQFAYIKCSESDQPDSMFTANIKGAKASGIKWGPYHFLRVFSVSAAKVQADYYWGRIKGTGYTLLPAVDCESYDGQNTAAGVRACIRAFIDEFQKDSGFKPLLYTYTAYANEVLRGQFSDCKLWQSDVRGYAGKVTGWNAWTAWQYSWTGSISAIANNVDLDVARNDIVIAPFTHIDAPTPGAIVKGMFMIGGWAISPAGVSRVDAYADVGTPQQKGLASIHVLSTRADVGRAYPQYISSSKSGWTCIVPAGRLSPGKHTISVAGIAKDGTVKWVSEQITVK